MIKLQNSSKIYYFNLIKQHVVPEPGNDEKAFHLGQANLLWAWEATLKMRQMSFPTWVIPDMVPEIIRMGTRIKPSDNDILSADLWRKDSHWSL